MATSPNEITEDQWAVLRTLYSSPDDIDLYAAGQVITERRIVASWPALAGWVPGGGRTDWSHLQLHQSLAVQEADGWRQVFLHSQEPKRQLYSNTTWGNQEEVQNKHLNVLQGNSNKVTPHMKPITQTNYGSLYILYILYTQPFLWNIIM